MFFNVVVVAQIIVIFGFIFGGVDGDVGFMGGFDVFF